ncbi:MAG: sigma factor-like helix-turn-helix DNA-binding protein [Candidatus Gracilibacteria bacterium]|jgi:hypothetical protein|nr:sigma factor-like helix-turn-helix DNA-binding protein [Candidatus Gracilibacteria bacterium]
MSNLTNVSNTQLDELKDLDLSLILEELFMVLSGKEKEVVTQRFSLDNKPKRTLESIGQQFSVTRERIRQIEKIALSKLRRTVATSSLNQVNNEAIKILNDNGGLLTENNLVAGLLNSISSKNELDGNIIRLALSINQSVQQEDKTNIFHPFWYIKTIDLSIMSSIIDSGIKILKKKDDCLSDAKIIVQIRQVLGAKLENVPDSMILSSLEIDKRIKRTEDGFGLMVWRHINPKSIRDKAYIVLKREGKPLHFVDIANKIIESGFDKKIVTIQAVHNELIRYDQFVLVGRGLYALKEFGYKKGTVTEIIEDLLRQNSPLSKQEIMEGVLAQRHVKKGTISLNLQKNPQFVRVGRAVYKLNENLKKKK